MNILEKTDHTKPPIRVATYVRMSTEKQNYSAAHQREYLQKFATDRGFSVVQEYADEGKSGLALRDRPGLRALLSQVQHDSIPFKGRIGKTEKIGR